MVAAGRNPRGWYVGETRLGSWGDEVKRNDIGTWEDEELGSRLSTRSRWGDIGGDSHTTRWCRSVFVYRVIIVFEEGIGWRRTARRLRVVGRSPIFGFDGGIPEAF